MASGGERRQGRRPGISAGSSEEPAALPTLGAAFLAWHTMVAALREARAKAILLRMPSEAGAAPFIGSAPEILARSGT
jgi:hypothetical protein